MDAARSESLSIRDQMKVFLDEVIQDLDPHLTGHRMPNLVRSTQDWSVFSPDELWTVQLPVGGRLSPVTYLVTFEADNCLGQYPVIDFDMETYLGVAIKNALVPKLEKAGIDYEPLRQYESRLLHNAKTGDNLQFINGFIVDLTGV